ncbi:MAG: MFS transporter [Bacteroidia bacterium]|nr:MFS transporter [Bacteroidia bacterium]
MPDVTPPATSWLLTTSLGRYLARPQTRAIGLVFMMHSLLFASWLTHIPYVKDRLGIGDDTLGMALFFMPVGLLVMNPLTGWFIRQFGAARMTLISAALFGLVFTIPVHASSFAMLALGLFLQGAMAALLNVSMNTCVTMIERRDGVSILSTSHGMWSLGGMSGAFISSGVQGAGFTPSQHILGIMVMVLLLLAVLRPRLLEIQDAEAAAGGTSAFFVPNKRLMILIFLGLCFSLSEGAAFDWSTVYLRDVTHAPAAVAALAIAFFSGAMTLGRLMGDNIIPRLGAAWLMQAGGLLGAAGLGLAIVFPYTLPALIGFMMLGLGISLAAPILYQASMRIPGVSPAAGLAAYASYSFMGFLAGPPLIGYISENIGLAWGLGLAGIMLLLMSAVAGRAGL